MERYNRAWRDPKSPLTPLTPLTTRVFNFENTPMTSTSPTLSKSQNDCARKPKASHLNIAHQLLSHTTRATGACAPKHFSQDFMRIRSVFSPCAQSTIAQRDYATPKHSTTQSTQQKSGTASRTKVPRQFKRSSPVDQPKLSPRVRSLLSRTGNEHLTELFTRQEIDLQVLIQMTLEDLESLGVRGVKELKLAIDVIKFAKKFF